MSTKTRSDKMINVNNLSEFLTANVNGELYPRLFVISRPGKLVASSSPFSISQIQDEAALVALAWKEASAKLNASTGAGNTESHKTSRASSKSTQPPNSSGLKALTIESTDYNILVRAVQSNLLMVLVGGIPKLKKSDDDAKREFKMVPESFEDAVYPTEEEGSTLEDEIVKITARTGRHEQGESEGDDGKGKESEEDGRRILRLQRRKLEKLAEVFDEEAKVLNLPEGVAYGRPY